jgi:outer membrane protein
MSRLLLVFCFCLFVPVWTAYADAPDPFAMQQKIGASAGRPWNAPAGGAPCSADHPQDKPWTLAEVVDRALCHNPRTRVAWASARAAADQLGVATGAYLPTLSVAGGRTRSRSTSDAVTTHTASSDVTATLNYLLFDFGGRSATLERAQQNLLAANWSHDAVLQSVWLSAVQAYYQLFSAQASVNAARAAERAARQALDAAAYRLKVGVATRADSLQARTAYSQAALARRQAEGSARIARGVLANVMGFDADRTVRVAPPDLSGPVPAREAEVHQLIAQAKAARPDLAAAQARVAAAQAEVKATRAQGRPSISLFSRYGRTWNDGLADSRGSTLGVDVSIPLFSGFATNYQIRAAQAQVQNQAAARDQLSQQVALDVWQAYQNLNTARETLSASADVLASATEAADLALGRYKAGVGTILELLDAQSKLAAARQQRVQAQYNWFIAKAVLAQSLGRQDVIGLLGPEPDLSPLPALP